MWYTNSCPACRGSLYDSDDDPGYVICLMCAREFKLVKKGNNNDKTTKKSN